MYLIAKIIRYILLYLYHYSATDSWTTKCSSNTAIQCSYTSNYICYSNLQYSAC